HATAPEARQQKGRRLHEVVDILLDNQGALGDACISLDGLDQRVGPTSTVVGSAMLNAVVAESAELMIARGHIPAVFSSSNVEHGDSRNEALISRYSPLVRAL
ncbi:MAG: hypothetical protein ABI586_09420, partial [Candidatus Nanopelagicales bacterium]